MIALVLVGTCGCTSTSTSSSNSASSSPTLSANQKLALDNLAGAINDKYKAANYTINTPFAMTKEGDTVTYKGVVTDGAWHNTSIYTRNVTIVLTPDRTTANTTLNSAISRFKADGYQQVYYDTHNGVTTWNGYLGTSRTLSTPKVQLELQEPAPLNVPVLPGGNTGSETLGNVDLGNYFEAPINQYAPPST